RVLPTSDQAAFKRPRETCLVHDVADPHRFVSIYGGKLTAYRATALKVLQCLADALPEPSREGDTKFIKLQRPSSTY
ncbi:MAG: FAD-dependent oxidoreductase, partial [Thiohalomonadales bacterium]